MTVTEALARGIPAIVGRDTGAEEALAAGGNTPGAAIATDEPELAVMLGALLTDPDLRNQWRERARIARAALPPLGAIRENDCPSVWVNAEATRCTRPHQG